MGRENNEATSRLVKFLDVNINEKGDKDTLNNLYNYSGGPGSVLGVGRTDVTMLSDQRTGRNNKNLIALSSCNTETKKPRIGITGIAIESSSFSPAKTYEKDFNIKYGSEIFTSYNFFDQSYIDIILKTKLMVR